MPKFPGGFVDGKGNEVSKTHLVNYPPGEVTYPLPKGTFEDHFPFLKVGCVSFLEGIVYCVFVESYLSAVGLSHSGIWSNLLLLSFSFQSIAYNACVFKKSIYMDHTLYLYDVNLQGLLLTLQGRFSSKLRSKKRNGMGGWPGRKDLNLVPICKEAESMIFFDVPPWEMHGISMVSLRKSAIFLDSHCNLGL